MRQQQQLPQRRHLRLKNVRGRVCRLDRGKIDYWSLTVYRCLSQCHVSRSRSWTRSEDAVTSATTLRPMFGPMTVTSFALQEHLDCNGPIGNLISMKSSCCSCSPRDLSTDFDSDCTRQFRSPDAFAYRWLLHVSHPFHTMLMHAMRSSRLNYQPSCGTLYLRSYNLSSSFALRLTLSLPSHRWSRGHLRLAWSSLKSTPFSIYSSAQSPDQYISRLLQPICGSPPPATQPIIVYKVLISRL